MSTLFSLLTYNDSDVYLEQREGPDMSKLQTESVRGPIAHGRREMFSFVRQELKTTELLNRMASTGAISLCDVVFSREIVDCEAEEVCRCEHYPTERRDLTKLRSGSVVVNTLTGETLETMTPILAGVDRFLRNLYRWSGRKGARHVERTLARHAFAEAAEEPCGV